MQEESAAEANRGNGRAKLGPGEGGSFWRLKGKQEIRLLFFKTALSSTSDLNAGRIGLIFGCRKLSLLAVG